MPLSVDSAFYIYSLADTGALLFLSIYIIITLSDLDTDHINATSCCSKLNTWVVPEMIANITIFILMLVSSHWILFLLHSPMTIWLIYKFRNVPKGNIGVYDPTEIHNRGNLKMHIRDSIIRLLFHMIFFFIFLFCLIISVLKRH